MRGKSRVLIRLLLGVLPASASSCGDASVGSTPAVDAAASDDGGGARDAVADAGAEGAPGDAGGVSGFSELCACETCSGHGTCVETKGSAGCQCDPGYVASGLSCSQLPGAFGTTYFVSPAGADVNAGTTAQQPLKTIAKALSLAKAGDAVKLEAGATFSEPIALAKGYGGAKGSPITITSDPTNRAKLSAPAGKSAISVYDASFVTFENLVVVGPGAGLTSKEGVGLMSDGPFEGIALRNVEVSGFYRGVFVYGAGTSGYSNLLLEGVSAHDNTDAGIATYADMPGAHHGVTVRRCLAYGNLGDPVVKRPSGDGIVLGGVTDGVIETSVAHDNGGKGTNSAGPVGIWTYDSRRVTIQYNESYSNHAKLQDGDAFDLDVGTTDSVLQYNYAHDNDGAGLILCQSGTAPNSNNVVRYNVSEDDARKEKMGALTWCDFGPGPGLTSSIVYGNTIVTGYGPAVNPTLLATSSGHLVFNNIFATSNGKPVIWNWNTVKTKGLIAFTGNAYWSSGVAADFEGSATFDAWRAAQGQETQGGAAIGALADPRLEPFVPACVGKGGARRPRVAKWRIGAGSPAIDRGLLPTKWVKDPGTHDFWGTLLPQGAAFDVGAEEVAK